MPLDYSDPNILKFLTENFNKTEERRMIWFLKNQEKLVKSASFPENYKGVHTLDVKKVNVELCMPFMTLNHKTNVVNRRKKPLRDGIIQGLSQLKPSRRKGQKPQKTLKLIQDISVPEPIMKKADPDVQNILYEPLPNGGRLRYLDKRKRMLPEDKYNFCETSTNVYGWRLKDSELSRLHMTPYGRYFTFKRDINSRSGPQPDPTYYQQPPNNHSKCFD